jgi:four helix bundle protein
MTIKSYEDLRIWREGVDLAVKIYHLTNEGIFSRDFGLRDQLRRAIISVSSNIVEGYERGSQKEFIRFLYIAKASACEARSQLYIAERLSYITKEQGEVLAMELRRLTNSIGCFISYLQKRNTRTRQHVNTQT